MSDEPSIEKYPWSAGVEAIYPDGTELAAIRLSRVAELLKGRGAAAIIDPPNRIKFAVGIDNGDSETAKQDTEELVSSALAECLPGWQVLRCTGIVTFAELSGQLDEMEETDELFARRSQRDVRSMSIITSNNGGRLGVLRHPDGDGEAKIIPLTPHT